MAKEVLAIPEDHVEEVVAVIRAGLADVPVDDEVYDNLSHWCDDMQLKQEEEECLTPISPKKS